MNLSSLFKPSAQADTPLETLRQILQQCENEGVMGAFALTRCRELGMPILSILAEQIAKNDERCRELVKMLADARRLSFSKVVDALRHPFMQSWLCGIHAPRCHRCGHAHALPHCEQCWQLMQPNLTTAQFKAQSVETDERDAETLLKLCQLSMPPVDAERFEEMTGIKLAGITIKAEEKDPPRVQLHQEAMLRMMARLPHGHELKIVVQGGQTYFFATPDGLTMTHQWNGREWAESAKIEPVCISEEEYRRGFTGDVWIDECDAAASAMIEKE